MILRLWRARVRSGLEPALLDRLREIVRLHPPPSPTEVTFGFRQEAGRTIFLALSAWPDHESILNATGGDASRPNRRALLDDMVDESQASIYEDHGSTGRVAFPNGRLLAVVVARVKPQHEGSAQELVEAGAAGALRAGALAAHLGRRLDGDVAELAILVVWPRREAMAQFVRSRDVRTINPAFDEHVLAWRFETYTALDPERLVIPAVGPGVIVMDLDGRLVDSTPGVENVLGIPGELLQGRSILELAPTPDAASDFRRRFLETGVSHGHVELRRPDGLRVRARYRSIDAVPHPGLRSVVVALSEDPDDERRPTADIVFEALGIPESTLSA